MKKYLIILFLIALLAGCASAGDDLAAYRKFSASEIFTAGEQELAKGDYKAAAKRFEALDAIYPFGPYAQQARLDAIYAYYMDNELESALAAADRYVRLYPRGPYADYAYYMKGVISFEQGMTWFQRKLKVDPAARDITDKRQAFVAFSEVVTRWPNSPYAADSYLHMAYIRNIIARQEVLVAAFYMKRGAYVAAANRASSVVEHYDGSPEVIPALAIMVDAYRKLHLDKMADNTLAILKASYPGVPQIRKLERSSNHA